MLKAEVQMAEENKAEKSDRIINWPNDSNGRKPQVRPKFKKNSKS
jgi:hypothetical protein